MKHSVLLLFLCGAMAAWAQADGNGPKPPGINLTSVVVSRVCTPALVNIHPTPETEFLTTDPSVCIFFEYNGGHKGDKIRTDWINPLGTVVRVDRGEHPTEGGNRYWQWTLPIANGLGAFAPGDWRVSVFWNDMGIASQPFRITTPPAGPVEMISKTLLPSGTTGVPYSYTFKIRGGEGALHWSASGVLPPGLSLSDDGTLAGSPSKRDGYGFTVTARDQAGHTLTRRVGLGIGPAPPADPGATHILTDHRSPGCEAGRNPADFPNTQPEVWLAFKMTGSKGNDSFEDDWINPAGEIVARGWYRQKGDTPECFQRRLRLAQEAATQPGDWHVRVLWNGGEAFSVPFHVSSSEMTTARVTLPGRWALLIGNSAYEHLAPIPSATGDIDLLGTSLRSDGFDVTSKPNLSIGDLRRAEREFLAKVQKGGVVVVYYSGYGLHGDGGNWLVPVNFDPADDRPFSTKAYSVVRLRQLLEEKEVKLKIFFLNAGRAAGGLESKTHQPGLAPPPVDPQTVMCLAVAPGRTEPVQANEKTSTFARLLADLLKRPDVGLPQLLGGELRKQAEGMAGATAPVTFMKNPEPFSFAPQKELAQANPKLVVDPTILADGDPHPKVSPPSIGIGSGGGIGGGVYRVGRGISAPVPIYKPEPEYSEEARQAKLEGTVALTVVVDEQGNTRDIRVVRSLGLGLDQKAIEAVQKWKFRPGMKDGRPVPVLAAIEVNFRFLKDADTVTESRMSPPKTIQAIGHWSARDLKFDLAPGTQAPRVLQHGFNDFPTLPYAVTIPVSLDIDAQGHAQNVQAQAPPPFDGASIAAAVGRWTFAPAQQANKPIAVHGGFVLFYQTAPGVVAGVPGGIPGGVPGGVLGSIPGAAPPPPPPPRAVKGKPPVRIRVGAEVEAANLITQVAPVYPPLAKQARVQGTVKFSAVIGKDGTVQQLTLVSGHPLLVKAAQEAVKRWQYKPTLLNGEPVEVMTIIAVNFTLSQ